MKLTTQQIIDLARKHVNNQAEMRSSAVSCLDDAIGQQLVGNDDNARSWALSALKYSVGIMHPDYKLAKDGWTEARPPRSPLTAQQMADDYFAANAACNRVYISGAGFSRN